MKLRRNDKIRLLERRRGSYHTEITVISKEPLTKKKCDSLRYTIEKASRDLGLMGLLEIDVRVTKKL